ncbi:hypothetical protein [Streptomyces crystallinus]|uniref:Secreted protein n=1 Tax=Streptomyces crystallinus TaxID=68191 RepID=A0ABP3QF77_9ACTN
MRRCATVAAIALCGAVAAGTAGPAFAAASQPVPVGDRAPVQDRRDGDAAGKTETVAWIAEWSKFIADQKKTVEGDAKTAQDDVKNAIKEAQASFAQLQKEMTDLFKTPETTTTVPSPG